MTDRDPYRWLDVSAGVPGDDVLEAVAGHLEEGGLVASPTETVYGFGGLLRGRPLERLRKLKDREPDRPFLLVVADRSMVDGLRWSGAARTLAEVFWPGPLTLVLADPSGAYPEAVRGSTGGVAVRETSHPTVRALSAAVGGALTSTSANRPSRPPARTAEEAAAAARALGAGAEMWILDGGPLAPSEPSTIVDCTGREPVVLREGAIPVDRLSSHTASVHTGTRGEQR